MSYNQQGSYGYSPYFNAQDNQAHHVQQQHPLQDAPQSSGVPQYQSHSSSYTPYYQTAAPGNYVQPLQTAGNVADTSQKSSASTPSAYNATYTQLGQRNTARSPVYPSSHGYASSVDNSNSYTRGGHNNGANHDISGRSYADTSALGSLAYASSLNQNTTSSSYQTTDYRSRRPHTQASYMSQDSNYRDHGSQSLSRSPNVLPQPVPTMTAHQSHSRIQTPVQTKELSSPSHNTNHIAAHTAREYETPQQHETRAHGTTYASEPAVTEQQNSYHQNASLLNPPVQRLNSPNGTHSRQPSSPRQKKSRPDTPNTPLPKQHKKPSQLRQQSQHRPESTAKSPLMSEYIIKGDESHHTTVDPNQIFDQVEYQRRKAAAEAEEAERAKLRAKETSQLEQVASSMINVVAPTYEAGQPNHSRSDSHSREAIQSEMRAMIEKMRQYKAQDPTGFSEIWEQFKKVQPPAPRASSQTPQMTKAGLPSVAHPGRNTIVPPVTDINTSTTPFAPQQDVTPQPSIEVRHGDDKPLPDLGKFPAMRRKRKSIKDSQSAIASPAMQEDDGGPEQALQRKMNDQAQPATKTKPRAIWPDCKRQGLAEVAKRALESNPANAGRTIQCDEIKTLFAKNPSYEDLCSDFRQRGFAFDSAAFARIMLTAINSPDGRPSQSPATASDVRPKRDSTIPSAIGPALPETSDKSMSGSRGEAVLASTANERRPTDFLPTPTSSTSAAPLSTLPDSMSNVFTASAAASPIGSKSTTKTLSGRKQSMSTQPDRAKDVKPLESTPSKPLTKEQMAHKRDFKDLVDLTQQEDDDSDNEPDITSRTPSFNPQHALPPPTEFSNTASNVKDHTPSSMHMDRQPTTTSESYSQPMSQTTTIPYNGVAPSSTFNVQQFKAPQTEALGSALETLRNEEIVQQIDYSKALRKRIFNPATIARDVLVSRGEHPSMRELNFHLSPLRIMFKHVNYKSDLSTLKWDLIDPGEPRKVIPGAEERKEPSMNSGAPKERASSEASAIQYRSPSPTMPPGFKVIETGERQSIMTRGRSRGRPRGRPRIYGPGGPTRAEIAARRKKKAEEVTDSGLLSISGRNAVDAPNPSVISPQVSTAFTPINSHSNSTNMGKIAEGDSDTSMESDSDPHAARDRVNKSTPTVVTSDFPGHSQGLNLTGSGVSGSTGQPRKRGRPPKSLVGEVRKVNSGPGSSDLSPSDHATQTARKRGRPPGSKNSPLAKRPGRPAKPRPSGIRTTMPDDGVGVLLPSRSPSTSAPLSYVEVPPPSENKPRRWKARPTYPEETPDPDAFLSFPCRWIGCSAELHNLETLGKHVLKMHAAADHSEIFCLWSGCHKGFDGQELFRKHMAKTHLHDLAVELGDGPSTHPTVLEPMMYLSDSLGNQVTPTIKAYGTPDPLPLNAGKSPTKAYHRAHRNFTPEQKARAEAASLRFHSQVAGNLDSHSSTYQTSAPAEILGSDSEDMEDAEVDAAEGHDDGARHRNRHAIEVRVHVPSRLRHEANVADEFEDSDEEEEEEEVDDEGSNTSIDPLA